MTHFTDLINLTGLTGTVIAGNSASLCYSAGNRLAGAMADQGLIPCEPLLKSARTTLDPPCKAVGIR